MNSYLNIDIPNRLVRRFLLVILSIIPASVIYSADNPIGSEKDILFRDNFSKPTAAPWTWIRENPQNHRFGETGMEIRLEPGGLMGEGKDAKNLLVRPLPPEAKWVSVQVGAAFTEQFEQAGLIVYIDDDNYIKLVNEFVDGKAWVVLVVEIKAKPRVLNKVPQNEPTVCIGLNFQEGKFTAFAWGTDKKPVQVGTDSFPITPRTRIGVFTQGGLPNLTHWAKFTDFLTATKMIHP